jgi:hypothetical protein
MLIWNKQDIYLVYVKVMSLILAKSERLNSASHMRVERVGIFHE